MTNDPLSPQSNDSQKRLLLALALSFAATAAYTFFFAPKGPPPGAEGTDAGVEVASTLDAGTPGMAAVPPPGVGGEDAGTHAEAPPPPARTAEFARPEVKYTFSSEGAGLTSAVLQGTKMREQQSLTVKEGFEKLFGKDIPPPPQMNVAHPVPGQPLPLAVTIEGGAPLAANTRYAVQEGPTDNGGSVVFTGRQGPWEVTKTVLWPREGFEFTYTLQVRNTSAQAQAGELKVHYGRAIDPEFEHAPSFFGGVGNLSRSACWVEDKLHNLSPGDKPPEETKGPISFFGINQQYFLAALYPLDGALNGHCTLTATPTAREVSAGFPLNVAPGQVATFRFGGYAGPKDPDLLRLVPGAELRSVAGLSTAAFHPMMEDTVDFGIWAVVCKILLAVMKFFHGIVGNWGVAIILLTVVVKLVLLPLTYRSMVSMEAVKVLQPKMEEIRKKFADDKERQNMEIMKLYQEAKVNPLGGCLPLLIQMPVWIALFTSLRNSFEIYGEPFFGPIWRDLTYKDPTYILPLALGVSMIITQKMQPQMMDAAQARMMTWVMPVIFTFTLLQYPAGLSLYIFTNNVLSIGQQWGLRKWLDRNKKNQTGGGTPAVITAGGGKRK
ncbi:membrane protein insertase YidC [Corallococcus exiguus]|uniref:membrane protein insertase YidC n=1 Tax=Corallococcus TaxID=83461 RepID=UPI000EC8252B|nr:MULTISPECIES: membrane protein insertase YidC [Corallococcus]NNC08463.1 membrane protein insertase YidC [Corallococcus exiguus]NPC47369.1 membrane protein insertase YidC [Corallococcus exiguus]RKH80100.1 membrane protein insertase YidC [Corallococcus sp. AB032C]